MSSLFLFCILHVKSVLETVFLFVVMTTIQHDPLHIQLNKWTHKVVFLNWCRGPNWSILNEHLESICEVFYR